MSNKFRICSVVGLLVLFSTGGAYALCPNMPGGTISPRVTFPAIPPIDRHAGMGEVLATVSVNSSETNFVNCDSDTVVTSYSYMRSAGTNIFESGIPGVGLRILVNGNYVSSSWIQPSGPQVLSWGDVTLELVKIGNIGAGGDIRSPRSDNTFLMFADSYWTQKELRFQTLPNVVVANPTCSVNSAVIDVDMGSVNLSELAATGRSSPKDFTIDLTCSGGTAGGSTDVYVTLTDQNQTSNRTNQLTLTSGGATGVVMEVNNKNGLVTFGADSEAPGNPGQWLEGTASNGAFSIPLSVNYLQVNPNPRPGVANAVASYTLSYQ